MTRSICWLEADDPFPDPRAAWGTGDPAPGLLAAGGSLDSDRLHDAYRAGIFPWFSAGQPILWWSTDPRMVLRPGEFRLHRSLRKTLNTFTLDANCEIRIDHDFRAVISACATSERNGQTSTWILPQMVEAYCELHVAGRAHSVETWIDGELAGGLYCVAIGRAVFGESMFARRTNASKIALAALVAFCLQHDIEMVDCQQNTSHLASLGAREMPRADFLAHVHRVRDRAGPDWSFAPVYWNSLLSSR